MLNKVTMDYFKIENVHVFHVTCTFNLFMLKSKAPRLILLHTSLIFFLKTRQKYLLEVLQIANVKSINNGKIIEII